MSFVNPFVWALPTLPTILAYRENIGQSTSIKTRKKAQKAQEGEKENFKVAVDLLIQSLLLRCQREIPLSSILELCSCHTRSRRGVILKAEVTLLGCRHCNKSRKERPGISSRRRFMTKNSPWGQRGVLLSTRREAETAYFAPVFNLDMDA